MLSNPVIKKQLTEIKHDARGHEDKLQEMIGKVIESTRLDSSTVEDKAQETKDKVEEMMHVYLGEEFDMQEALEFLCLTKGGEIIHYEVLNSLTSKAKDKKFGVEVKRILREEKINLKLCMSLAKQNVKNDLRYLK